MIDLSSELTPLSQEDKKMSSRAMVMSPSAESILRSRVQETLSLGNILNIMRIRIQMVLLFGVIIQRYGLILQKGDSFSLPKNLTPSISELLVGSPSVKLLPRSQRG